MSLVRISEEGIAKRRESISRLKAEMRDLEEMAGQKESILWKRIGPRIDRAIDANREKIESILSAGPNRQTLNGEWETVDAMADFASLKALGGAIAFAKLIKSEVEVESVIERKRVRLNEMIEELKKIESEQS